MKGNKPKQPRLKKALSLNTKRFDYEDFFMGVLESKNYSKKRTFTQDYRLKKLTEFLKLEKGNLLDIGCGGGIITESLPYYYPKVSIYGCDISLKAIKFSKKLGSGKVNYSLIKNKRLPYPDNYFDACIALDVIEHIPNVTFFLKEVKRVLKKDGYFFSHTPCEGQKYTHTWFSKKLGFLENITFKRYGHIHPEFTHQYLEQMIENAGFKIKQKDYSEHFIYQFLSLIFYFIPLEVLEKVLGKKADLYKDKKVVESTNKNKDGLMDFRRTWLKLTAFSRLVTYWELVVFKKVPFGALKLNVLSIKK